MPDDYGNPDPEWLKSDWRRDLRQVDVGGTTVNLVDVGEGPPVIFIHGLGGCWQNWLENLPHFAAKHRAIAVDLPGFGRSPMPPWEIDIPAYGRFVDDLCETLGIETAVLVGNSMGGFVAAEAAIAFPDRVDRLVLVSAAGISQTQVRKRPLMFGAQMIGRGAQRTLGDPRGTVSRHRMRRGVYGWIFRYPERLRPELLYEQYVNGFGKPAFLPALTELLGYDFRERLPEIRVPALVVWGRNDLIVPPQDADEFERLIPQARKVVFDKTGHVPQMERPGRFNRIVESFVEDRLADTECATGPTEFRRPRALSLVERVARKAA